MTGDTAPRTETAEMAPSRAAWVSWFFNAATRASPVRRWEPSGATDSAHDALADAPYDTQRAPG